MTEYITEYPHLCDKCNATIRSVAASVIPLGPDDEASDPEAPCNYVYDHAMFCGGRTCRHGWNVGDVAEYDDQIVTLTRWSSGGGFFDAETFAGETVYPDPEDLEPVREFVAEVETILRNIGELADRIDEAACDICVTETTPLAEKREWDALGSAYEWLSLAGQRVGFAARDVRRYHRAHN